MMETSSKTTSTELVNTSGPMEEFTRENGSTTKWKATEFSRGVTAVDTLVNTKMTRNTATELSNGPMVASTSASGALESSTARVSTSRRERSVRVSGRWAKESSGSKLND